MLDEAVDKLDIIKQKIRDGEYANENQSYLDLDFDSVKADILQIKCMIRKSYHKGDKDGVHKTVDQRNMQEA